MNFNYPDLNPGNDSERQPDPQPQPAAAPETLETEEPQSGPWYIGARLISWILLPILVPVYGIILTFRLSLLAAEPAATKWIYTIIVFSICALFPMLCGFVMKALGIVSDTGLNKQSERTIPYIITILTMGGTMFFLKAHGMPMWVNMFFAGGALTGLICMLINLRWKISAHLAGMGGLTAMLFMIRIAGVPQHPVTGWIIAAIVASGALGSARIYMNRHTLAQVLAGFAVGFVSVFALSELIR